MLKNRYELLEPIGQGGFSKVYRAFDILQKRDVAVKISNLDELKKQGIVADRVLQEIRIHKQVGKHPNIVEYIDDDLDGDMVYLVMELCTETLGQYVKRTRVLNARTAAHILEQCLNVAQFLHRKNIVHRDLSYGNVLISGVDGRYLPIVKIADFGLAAELRPGMQQATVCGTPNFMAPEVVLRSGHNQSADIYSLGALLYFMLTGRTGLKSGNNEVSDTLNCIIRGERDSSHLSADAKSLVKQMMDQRPAQRISIEDIRRHPFMTRHLRKDASSTVSADSGHYEPSTYSAPAQYSSLRNYGAPLTCLNSVESRRHYRSPSLRRYAEHDIQTDKAKFLPDNRTSRSESRMSYLDGQNRCRSYLNTGACCGTCVTSAPTPYHQSDLQYSSHRPSYVPQTVPYYNALPPTDQASSANSSAVDDSPPLINTARMMPGLHYGESKKTLVRIMPDGDVWLEILKDDNNITIITFAMNITGNGRKITVFKPKAPYNKFDVNYPPKLGQPNSEELNYFDLKGSNRKKYEAVHTTLDKLKSKIQKITIYTGETKTCMYENGRVVVADGKGLMYMQGPGNTDPVITYRANQDGTYSIVESPTEQMKNSADMHIKYIRSTNCGLEALDKGDQMSLFPAVLGIKPRADNAIAKRQEARKALSEINTASRPPATNPRAVSQSCTSAPKISRCRSRQSMIMDNFNRCIENKENRSTKTRTNDQVASTSRPVFELKFKKFEPRKCAQLVALDGKEDMRLYYGENRLTYYDEKRNRSEFNTNDPDFKSQLTKRQHELFLELLARSRTN